MSDPNEHVRTRNTAHWSDGNVDITGKRGPEPTPEPEPEPEKTDPRTD
jgi:hypothetical protein